MSSSDESPTERAVDTLMDDSTNITKRSPKDPSTDKGSSIDRSLDISKDNVTDLPASSSENHSNGPHQRPSIPVMDPFGHPTAGLCQVLTMNFLKGIGITATNVKAFKSLPIFELKEHTYPELEDISVLANKYVEKILTFAADLVDLENANTVVADEISRVQQIFDKFGQRDPNWPPSMLVERLRDSRWRCHAVTYIINWALINNIAIDGDIEYTLLPPHVVAVYRDLDRHSSDAHRMLHPRWLQLTFGLLAGGHSGYQASAEAGRRIDRIRRFLVNLLGPYCIQHCGHESFSQSIDEIVKWAVAIGYHLMGVPARFRWDWTWLWSKSEHLEQCIVGEPPRRRPREEEVPKWIWITSPALVKETDEMGQQLAEEITFVPARQATLS